MMVCGDRVRLEQDLSLCDDGSVVYLGATGMVVGGQGAEGVVVSWDERPGLTSLVRERGLRNINRTRAAASRKTTSASSS